MFLNLVLLLVWVTWGGREFHVVMALFNTVHFPASSLDLGTVKTPLVACLVWYQWVSERCANCLNRQFCTINTSHKANSDVVNFSSTLTCMLTFALRVHLSAVPAALLWTNCNLHMSFFATQLGSRLGATKLGSVGPVWLIEMSRKQSNALWTDLFPF
jgi:hypothetical protein